MLDIGVGTTVVRCMKLKCRGGWETALGLLERGSLIRIVSFGERVA